MFLIPIWTEVTIWKIINRLSKLFKFFLLSNLWARKNMNEASSEFRRLRNAVASEVRRIPEGIMSIICGHRSCDDLWSVPNHILTSKRNLGLSSIGDAGATGGLYCGSGLGLGGGGVCIIARASFGNRSGGAEHCDAARPTSSSVSVRSVSVPTAKKRGMDEFLED